MGRGAPERSAVLEIDARSVRKDFNRISPLGDLDTRPIPSGQEWIIRARIRHPAVPEIATDMVTSRRVWGRPNVYAALVKHQRRPSPRRRSDQTPNHNHRCPVRAQRRAQRKFATFRRPKAAATDRTDLS